MGALSVSKTTLLLILRVNYWLRSYCSVWNEQKNRIEPLWDNSPLKLTHNNKNFQIGRLLGELIVFDNNKRIKCMKWKCATFVHTSINSLKKIKLSRVFFRLLTFYMLELNRNKESHTATRSLALFLSVFIRVITGYAPFLLKFIKKRQREFLLTLTEWRWPSSSCSFSGVCAMCMECTVWLFLARQNWKLKRIS